MIIHAAETLLSSAIGATMPAETAGILALRSGTSGKTFKKAASR